MKTSKSVAALAKQHGVTPAQLSWFNPGLRTTKKGNVVRGQTVRVPMKSALAFARNVPDPGIENYGTAVATSTSRGVHVVRRGETIGGIARRYGITESRLRALNRIRGDRILAGQTLVVRSNSKKR
jgi:LysM repeat protein